MYVGRHTYGAESITLLPNTHGAELIIGNYCSIAADVTIHLGGEHRTDHVSTYPFHELDGIGNPTGWTKGDVTIGSDVWICYGATILSGVTIGHGAVIAARAMVTKDVPPYHIVGGNPARTIRARFNDHTIKALLDLAWWDWDDTHIRAAAHLLTNPDPWALLDHG